MKAALILWILRAAPGQVKLNFRGNHRGRARADGNEPERFAISPLAQAGTVCRRSLSWSAGSARYAEGLANRAQGTADGNAEPVGLIIKRGGYLL